MPKYTSALVQEAAAARPVVRWSTTSRSFIIATVISVGLTFIALFLASSFQLMAAAAAIGLPGWSDWVLPLGVDATLLSQSLAVAARRGRGQTAYLNWAMLCGFSLASIGINIWISLSRTHVTGAAIYAHIGIAVLIPLGILAASESVISVLIQPAAGDARQRQALARLADQGLLTSGAASAEVNSHPAVKADKRQQIRSIFEASGRSLSIAALARKASVSQTTAREAISDLRQAKTTAAQPTEAKGGVPIVPQF